MPKTKATILEILNSIPSVGDMEVIEVHGDVLNEYRSRDENELKEVSSKLNSLVRGVVSTFNVEVGKHEVFLPSPMVRVYLSLDEESDLPYVKVTLSKVKAIKFDFKYTLSERLDSRFKESFINFLDETLSLLAQGYLAQLNIEALNGALSDIKAEIEEEGSKVAFDIEFANSDKTFEYLSNDKVVLGTSVETMLNLLSPNTDLYTLFEERSDDLNYIADALKESIKEDWITSPNPLVFIRKNNVHLTPLISGELTTRRTQRVDMLVRRSFTLKYESLKNRNVALAHRLETEGDETYISVYDKSGKDADPVQILSPINIDSLVYKGS